MSNTTANMLTKYIPLLETIRTYEKGNLKKDIIAALTVAVIAIPQSMAYAIIAGVNPVYGLYTAIVSTIIASAFGSSNFLIAGPTNAISLLVASGMKNYMGLDNAYEMLFLMTFLVGVFQILFGVIKLGKVINYVSHSVIVGFTAGAGILIALGQLNQFLGVSIKNSAQMSTMNKLYYLLNHLNDVNYYSLGLGLLTIVVISVSKKISRNIPGALLGICVSIILVVTFNLEQVGVKLTGNIPSQLPPFKMINFDLNSIREVVGGAIAISIIGLVEAISISKSISAQSRQKIDANQEFIGQGLANTVSSFFQCFAGSGSFTRSAINYYSGAATRMAGIFSGIFVAVVLLFFAPYAKYIPMPSLAGVIVNIAYNMVNKKEMKKIFNIGKSDSFAMIVTACATILLPELDYAVYTGIIVSIALYLKDSSNAGVKVLIPVQGDEDHFVEKSIESIKSKIDTVIIQIQGMLYFGCAEELEKKLDLLIGKSEVVIIQMQNITSIDITSMDVLKLFIQKVKEQGGHVTLIGVSSRLNSMLEKSQVAQEIGAENIHLSQEEIYILPKLEINGREEVLRT